MSDDIKDLLSRAFEAEPPLRLDRDEVLKAGRKRLRRRRFLEAGGVTAAVVAAVVGASLLTGLVGSAPEDRMPPAASSSTGRAPAGPDLPLPQTTGPSRNTPLTREHADTLMDRLYASSVIKGIGALSATQAGGNQLTFAIRSNAYVFEADVATGNREGSLQVSVEAAGAGDVASCEPLDRPFDDCTVDTSTGIPVAMATWTSSEGEKQYLVLAIQDGTKVAALTTNLSSVYRDKGQRPSGEPVLDKGQLVKLVVYSGLRVR
jgi:hypothetical protein